MSAEAIQASLLTETGIGVPLLFAECCSAFDLQNASLVGLLASESKLLAAFKKKFTELGGEWCVTHEIIARKCVSIPRLGKRKRERLASESQDSESLFEITPPRTPTPEQPGQSEMESYCQSELVHFRIFMSEEGKSMVLCGYCNTSMILKKATVAKHAQSKSHTKKADPESNIRQFTARIKSITKKNARTELTLSSLEARLGTTAGKFITMVDENVVLKDFLRDLGKNYHLKPRGRSFDHHGPFFQLCLILRVLVGPYTMVILRENLLLTMPSETTLSRSKAEATALHLPGLILCQDVLNIIEEQWKGYIGDVIISEDGTGLIPSIDYIESLKGFVGVVVADHLSPIVKVPPNSTKKDIEDFVSSVGQASLLYTYMISPTCKCSESVHPFLLAYLLSGNKFTTVSVKRRLATLKSQWEQRFPEWKILCQASDGDARIMKMQWQFTRRRIVQPVSIQESRKRKSFRGSELALPQQRLHCFPVSGILTTWPTFFFQDTTHHINRLRGFVLSRWLTIGDYESHFDWPDSIPLTIKRPNDRMNFRSAVKLIELKGELEEEDPVAFTYLSIMEHFYDGWFKKGLALRARIHHFATAILALRLIRRNLKSQHLPLSKKFISTQTFMAGEILVSNFVEYAILRKGCWIVPQRLSSQSNEEDFRMMRACSPSFSQQSIFTPARVIHLRRGLQLIESLRATSAVRIPQKYVGASSCDDGDAVYCNLSRTQVEDVFKEAEKSAKQLLTDAVEVKSFGSALFDYQWNEFDRRHLVEPGTFHTTSGPIEWEELQNNLDDSLDTRADDISQSLVGGSGPHRDKSNFINGEHISSILNKARLKRNMKIKISTDRRIRVRSHTSRSVVVADVELEEEARIHHSLENIIPKL